MKKHPILFKTSAILSYLFLFFGLFWTTQFWSNYWEFSSWVGNLIWIRNIISLLYLLDDLDFGQVGPCLSLSHP